MNENLNDFENEHENLNEEHSVDQVNNENSDQNEINEDELNYSHSLSLTSPKKEDVKEDNSQNNVDFINHSGQLNLERKLTENYIVHFDSILSNIICFSCRKLPLEYRLLQCKRCENYFCESCSNLKIGEIEQVKSSISKKNDVNNSDLAKCPNLLCERFKPKKIDKLIQNLMKKIKLYCENKERGCEEEISYEHYLVHLENCDFKLVNCINEDCDNLIPLKDLVFHVNEQCQLTNLTCLFCNCQVQRKDFSSHQEQCDYREVKCKDGCGDTFLLKVFLNHREECDLIYLTCQICREKYKNKEKNIHDCFICFEDRLRIKEEDFRKEKEKLEMEKEILALAVREKEVEIEKQHMQTKELQRIKTLLESENEILKMKNADLERKLGGKGFNGVGGQNLTETLETDFYSKVSNLEKQLKKQQDENFNLKIFIENNNLTIADLKKQLEKYKSFEENGRKIVHKKETIAMDESFISGGVSRLNRDNNRSISPNKIENQFICTICNTNELTFKNSVKCKQCKETICLYCKDTCFICFQYFCEKHIKTCEKCSNPVCRGDVSMCEGCGCFRCPKCFDVDDICDKCTWKFDTLHKDKLVIMEDNKLVARTYNTSNCVGSLLLGDKIFDSSKRGVHKWELKVKSPICKVTDFGLIILQKNEFNFEEIKNIHKQNKISLKSITPFIINKQFSNLIFTLDLNTKTFMTEIEGKTYSEALKGNYLLPYFFICNNSIFLRQLFILSNY